MADDPSRPDRRSLRLHDCDYATPGLYFVTIVTDGRMTLFGEVIDGQMRLNHAGLIVRDEWLRTAVVRPNLEMLPNDLVVMPSHIHGIIGIREAPRATHRVAPTESVTAQADEPTAPETDSRDTTGPLVAHSRPRGPAQGSVGAIVGQFKSATTRQIRRRIPSARTPIWQRNFHDHVIRDQTDLDQIRKYILENPAKWETDRENPLMRTDP